MYKSFIFQQQSNPKAFHTAIIETEIDQQNMYMYSLDFYQGQVHSHGQFLNAFRISLSLAPGRS